jgi:hypothetical protein
VWNGCGKPKKSNGPTRSQSHKSVLRKFSGSKGEAGAYKAIVFDELTASLRLGGGVAAAGKMDISR